MRHIPGIFVAAGVARAIWLSFIVVASAALVARSQDKSTLSSAVVKSLPASICAIEFRGHLRNDPKRATGFLVKDSPHHPPVIVTAAHSLAGGPVITASFPKSNAVMCKVVDIHEDLDIAVLLPESSVKAPTLEFSTKVTSVNDDDPHLWLFGFPGLLNWSYEHGHLNAEALRASDLPRSWSADLPRAQRIPRGNTMLLRHSAPSRPGMSGGPLVDRNGKVIGVHIGHAPEAPLQSFAVSVHPEQRELIRLHEPFRDDIALRIQAIASRLPSVQPSAGKAVELDLGEGMIEVRSFNNGPAPSAARDLIHRHIKRSTSLLKHISLERIESLVSEVKFERVVNPVFSFKLLAPQHTTYTATALSNPPGVKLSINDKSDEGAKEPLFSVYAFRLPATVARIAEEAAAKKLPRLETASRRAAIASEAASRMGPIFFLEMLGCRVRLKSGKILGAAKNGEVFAAQPDDEVAQFTPYFYEELSSESSNIHHVIDGVVFDDIVLVGHFTFEHKQSQDTAYATRRLACQRVIQHSLAFYD